MTDSESRPWAPEGADDALRALVKGTEFQGIGFHTLRHSFSSKLARAHVDDRTIDHFMGHQTEEMRRRYHHLFPTERSSAIRRLDFGGPPRGEQEGP